jgi:hypothetical protein
LELAEVGLFGHEAADHVDGFRAAPDGKSRARIVDNAQQCSFAEEFRRLLDPNSGRRGRR